MTDATLEWTGGRLDGTPWQGILYVSLRLDPDAEPPAVLTARLNHPVGSLTADQIVVAAGSGLPVPPHETTLSGSTVTVRFHSFGDHSEHTFTLTDGGGRPLHPFFASARFRFTVDCEAGDCRPLPVVAGTARPQAPAVDLLTKDFNGFATLLADWVKVRNPAVTDLSPASFERVLLDLLAWAGDMTSYHQDRVAGEAFLETATQRFSLRQHALLLGTTLDEGNAPTTMLAFDVTTPGFVPEGLEVRARTDQGEAPISFLVAARTRVRPENSSGRLRIAAFPGAVDATVPAGATELLLWGHDAELAPGDRLALVQGTFAQVVTLSSVRRLRAWGWVPEPTTRVDELPDAQAPVTRLRWSEPLSRTLHPWTGSPCVLHGNLVEAVYGSPRRAVVGTGDVRRGEMGIPLSRRTSVLTPSGSGDGALLRAVRLPDWPVVHSDDGTGGAVPTVEVLVSDDAWTRVDHLHASHSFDLHYTAEADEDGAVWLGFGDGVRGREVAVDGFGEPLTEVRVRYRVGDPVLGNVGLGALVDIVRPDTGTDEEAALAALGDVTVTNVLPATNGRRRPTTARTRQMLPASLRHGALQRAVALDDYAAVAMEVPGVARAVARATGGPFNTVFVLVDPEGAAGLDEPLRARVAAHLEARRMTGREHVVQAAEYLPLDVELAVCPQPGVAGHQLRDRVLAELRPGSDVHPGWFHPDRLSFGDAVRLTELLAFVQRIAGVRSVTASVFRPLRATRGPAVQDVIPLGRTHVARLDADANRPENGRLEVCVVGLDDCLAPRRPFGAAGTAVEPGRWRVTGVVRRSAGSPHTRVRALGGPRPDGTSWRMTVEEAVAAMGRGDRFYVEEPAGDAVDVTVAHTAEGRVYLRTAADGDAPNNLLSLPELPDE